MINDQEIATHPYVIELLRVIEELKSQLTQTTKTFQSKIAELQQQVTWFQKQTFGKKSERRVDDVFPTTKTQLPLFSGSTTPTPAAVTPITVVAEHVRKKSNKVTAPDNAGQSGLRFGPEVRVEVISVLNPAIAGLAESEYEVVETRVVERLCQEKSGYFIKQYTTQVVKILSTGKLKAAAFPEPVIDSRYADISLLVGLLMDKFLYHLPIYRQHQRMAALGIDVSRGSLVNWVLAVISLLEPIYRAQESSVLESKVLSMDETPHKAGRRDGPGKLGVSQFWFLYGDKNEVYIHNNESKGAEVIRKLLKDKFHGTLLSDGAPAYEKIAAELQLLHAECWAHARRNFVEAEEQEPEGAKLAVAFIKEIYVAEAAAPTKLEEKLEYRLAKIKPLVVTFFEWLTKERSRVSLLPKNSYTKAVQYAAAREASLRVFLSNPEVPIDNNHTERQIRPLVLGRKNYLFCWSELGAKSVAMIQSLLLTCQLHDVDPHEYLTDVLTRISTHSQFDIAELTPRQWKAKFSKQALAVELPQQKAA